MTISVEGKEPHSILVTRHPTTDAVEPTDDKAHTVNWTGKHDGGLLETGPTSTFEANLVLAVVEAKTQAEAYMKALTSKVATSAEPAAGAVCDAKRLKTGSDSDDG